MTAYKVPEVKRFEFQVPGDEATYSLPSMLDLPPAKLKALAGMKDINTQDASTLERFNALFNTLADDDDKGAQKALATLALSQKIRLMEVYGDSSSLSVGESSAS